MLRQLFSLDDHVCPWWLTFTFDNPLRRVLHNPEQILGDLVRPGMIVADIGCGMGYFTMAMARMVGPGGRVIAVDLQAKMLAGVQKRGQRLGLASQIALHSATPNSLGLNEPVDFALAFWMVHEVTDQERFFGEVRALLRPEAKFLVVEPKIHVGGDTFKQQVASATAAGLRPQSPVKVAISRAMLFGKTDQEG